MCGREGKMVPVKFLESVLLCVIIFCTIASGITNIDPEKKGKIDNFVNKLLFYCDKHKNVVGMNLAVVYEGKILYTTGYGVKQLGKYLLCSF